MRSNRNTGDVVGHKNTVHCALLGMNSPVGGTVDVRVLCEVYSSLPNSPLASSCGAAGHAVTAPPAFAFKTVVCDRYSVSRGLL